MANVIEEAVETLGDLKDPKGKLSAKDAINFIVNKLEAGDASLLALDISGKKSEQEMKHEVLHSLSQRYARQGEEALADLRNPQGKLTAKAAESLISENFGESEKYLAKLDIKKDEGEKKERKVELDALLSKRYVRQGLEILDDLKNPEGVLDANVARLLVQSNFKDAKAHDASVSKIEEEITPVLNDSLSQRYARPALAAWKDLQDPKGSMDIYTARDTITNNFRDGGLTLAALDTTGTKTVEEMTADFNKAIAERAVRDNKPGIDLGTIMGWIKDLGVKHDAGHDNNIGNTMQLTPAIQSKATRSVTRD